MSDSFNMTSWEVKERIEKLQAHSTKLRLAIQAALGWLDTNNVTNIPTAVRHLRAALTIDE